MGVVKKNCQTRIASSFARYLHLTLLAGLVRAADGLSTRVRDDLKGVGLESDRHREFGVDTGFSSSDDAVDLLLEL